MNTLWFRFYTTLLLGLACSAALAQGASGGSITNARPGQTLQWQASTAQNAQVSSRQLQGKVSVVFVWSTTCAVCRSALPELRANAAGWKDKPFALVTLNVDAQTTDWLAYESLVARTAMPPPNLQTLWLGANAAPMRLPLTLVVDAQGKVRARFEGRMAPEAWDGVAELLL